VLEGLDLAAELHLLGSALIASILHVLLVFLLPIPVPLVDLFLSHV